MEAGSSNSQKKNTNITIKLDPETIEHKIITLAQTRPTGISDKDLAIELPDLKPIQRAQIINKLLSQGYFDLFKQGGSLYYRLKDPQKKAKGADNEEKIVYKIIEESGNKGIWIRDIRFKSNLTHAQLQKVLKSLETKKFVKVIKAVGAGKKKVYMLYNLKPDESITGGAWYQDQDFETEFVDILNQQCYRFLEQKKEKIKNCDPIAARNMMYASSTDVWKYISDSGISNVKLSVNNIEMILNTLVYDGKIERILSGDGSNLYRAIQPLMISTGLAKTPCGLCPINTKCSEYSAVTPLKCKYIQEWLE